MAGKARNQETTIPPRCGSWVLRHLRAGADSSHTPSDTSPEPLVASSGCARSWRSHAATESELRSSRRRSWVLARCAASVSEAGRPALLMVMAPGCTRRWWTTLCCLVAAVVDDIRIWSQRPPVPTATIRPLEPGGERGAEAWPLASARRSRVFVRSPSGPLRRPLLQQPTRSTRRKLVLVLMCNPPKRGRTRLRSQPFASPADLLECEAELEAS
jgi:hypothetical protein